MKKFLVVLVLVLFSASVFAQQLTVDGEIKTGILWTKTEDGINPIDEKVDLGSKDDAGDAHGRFRLNINYFNPDTNMGFKVRLNWEQWMNQSKAPEWPYAFGYGNFFQDQFTLSIGRLGFSPWGTGGPEMWKELDTSQSGGIRAEIKPSIVPGLNAGFIINYFNSPREAGGDVKLSLLEILKESVIGVSYTHDYFHVRFAYRLDSEYDQRVRNVTGEGDELLYRVEERILKDYLPGFQIWALGYYAGVGSPHEECIDFQNWLFAEYAPDMFTAQMRLGLDVVANRSIFHVRPGFYWNFFEKFVVVGALFKYGQDFGEGKVHPGSPYYTIEIEPKVQVNFSPNAYAAFAYNFSREYVHETPNHIKDKKEPIQQTQWMNLRVGFYF